MCFIDLNKAYDRVNHQAIFYRLQECGITGNVLSILREIYGNNRCTVRTVDGESPSFPYSNGVK